MDYGENNPNNPWGPDPPVRYFQPPPVKPLDFTTVLGFGGFLFMVAAILFAFAVWYKAKAEEPPNLPGLIYYDETTCMAGYTEQPCLRYHTPQAYDKAQWLFYFPLSRTLRDEYNHIWEQST
jgi:hypothetical protein